MSLIVRIAKRILPQPARYTMGAGSVVYPSASIINPLREKELICLGQHCHIKGELLLFGHGGRIAFGDYCYLGPNSHIWSARQISIGNRVLISHNCNIFDNDTHPLEPRQRHEQFKAIVTTGQPRSIDLREAEVIIEDDVLIAANSTILKGVRLGKAAIVGAGSVVTRDVPPGVIVAGNPARIVRSLDLGEDSVS